MRTLQFNLANIISWRCQKVLSKLPSDSVDFAMTSPPYWGKREYTNGGIGEEFDYRLFISDLVEICFQIKRVLRPEVLLVEYWGHLFE